MEAATAIRTGLLGQEFRSFPPWRRKRGREGRCPTALGESDAVAIVSGACHGQSCPLRLASGISARAALKSGPVLKR